MRHVQVRMSLLCAGLFLFACPTFAATVTFDEIPAGTIFGFSSGDPAGLVVHSEDKIDMSLEPFFAGDFEAFFDAEVGGRTSPLFPTPSLAFFNVSALFNFANVGFNVDSATLEFRELGDVQNFAVNGGTIHELASLTNVPVNVAVGVTANVANNTIQLSGEITSLRIGGQELVIDNVIAIPEPATTVLLLGAGTAWVLRRRLDRVF